MSYRGLTAALVLVMGCASAGLPREDQPDAPGGRDSNTGGDSNNPDSLIDGTTQCVVMTQQLLTNPTFDATPAGMGWTAAPINGTYPIVTADDGNSGVTEQSPTMKAWMAGFAQANATDSLYQDVMVPAGTTLLKLTGFYWTKSSEPVPVAYDTAKITIENGGTVVATALSLDNILRHTSWQALDFTVPVAGLSGQTIRLKFATASDSTDVTSFWFDTIALTATYCQ
jgi:hypothetical protein